MLTMIYRAFGRDRAWGRKRLITVAVTAAVLGAGVLSIAMSLHQGGLTIAAASSSTLATDSPFAWDRSHRDEFVQLKSQGDALAIQGKLQPAYDAYQQCLIRIADHELTDPVVIATLKSAQENQSLLMAQILVSDNSPLQAGSPVRDVRSSAGDTATGDAAPLMLASSAQPLDDHPLTDHPQSDDHLLNHQSITDRPRQAEPASPNVPGSGKLFDAPAAPITRQSGGSLLGDDKVTSNLQSNSNLPDLFQPYSGSEPEPLGGSPSPGLIVKRTPGVPGLSGPSTEAVIVTVGPRPPGSPPVTGEVDGHPFSIGGPGEPNSAVFTGLTPGPIPWSAQGQQFTFNGTPQSFTFANNGTPTPSPTTPPGGPQSATTPVGKRPVMAPPPSGKSPTVGPPKKTTPSP
jgi:hypothetical protein